MARGSARATRSKQSSEGKGPAVQDGVPQIYAEMLAEEEQSDDHNRRPTKRRRLTNLTDAQNRQHTAPPKTELESPKDIVMDDTVLASNYIEPVATQTVEDDEEESDDDVFEWEEVDLDGKDKPLEFDTEEAKDEGLSLTIGGPDPPSLNPKRRGRKPPTAAEKKIRLDVHKSHILCQLYHVHWRNHWCNDHQLHKIARNNIAISAKTIEKLHPDPTAAQLPRSRVFKEALTLLSETWRNEFSITSYGISRPSWNPSATHGSPEVWESLTDLKDYREQAKEMTGSADYGAQLFCALLRGLDVETRLVCSLQPLPFNATGALGARLGPIPTLYAKESDEDQLDNVPSAPHQTSSTGPRRIARLGQRKRGGSPRTSNIGTPSSSVTRRPKAVPRPRHPIFWVEAFDEAYQKWISVDPIVTGNVGKPLSLEPGLRDSVNLLSYAVAFEDDGTARDVTRRYTKAYNAKTRKLRVECTDRGIEWYKKAMKFFKRRRKLDRDDLEDALFLQKDMSEGMPRNIEDFKGHPIYVLERHLHRDQVIYPLREVGKVGQTTKSASASNLESVYRRQDVHVVRSADKWFRLGRQLMSDAAPLKHVAPRKRRELFDDSEADQTTAPTVGLYARFQTEQYIPPPVIDGIIPKNTFRNIDVYERTMIPAGAIHVKSEHGRQAARLLGIDFADAVTGFNFRGRHGTAIINGVVVSSQFKDAMLAVLEGIAYAQEQEIEEERSQRALALWRKFVVGLRIIERVRAYRGRDEEVENDDEFQRELVAEMRHYGTAESAANHDVPYGKATLLPEVDRVEIVESVYPPPTETENVDLDDLFEEPEEGGFVRETGDVASAAETHEEGGFLPEGAGFLPGDGEFLPGAEEQDRFLREDDETGGFMVDKSEDEKELQTHEADDAEIVKDEATQHPHTSQPLEEHAAVLTLDETPHEDLESETARSVEEEVNSAVRTLSGNAGSPRESEASDTHSLLSHDPEDDEVDPDWLD